MDGFGLAFASLLRLALEGVNTRGAADDKDDDDADGRAVEEADGGGR